MSLLPDWNWYLDGWIIAAGVLCAVSSALLGNFLVLRRMSMMGDAISHAILPGLAAAFIVTSSRSSIPMFVGAALVGVLTAVLTEWIRGAGRVDEGASMGVAFTALFALGLIMIVQAADHVDLDPGCVLYGAIELTPLDTYELGGIEVPRVAAVLGLVLIVNLTFVVLFYKELKISSFDPALATSVGIHARAMHYALMTLVAVTSVASFETVGNILVVAMFVAPPAAAYLLTDRLPVMILLSAVLATVSAVAGHIAALVVPRAFGFHSTRTAGMMAVAVGVVFALAALLAPRHGIVTRLLRRRLVAMDILTEDLMALLYRAQEERPRPLPLPEIQRVLMASPIALRWVVRKLLRREEVALTGEGLALTPAGAQRAQALVRSHRLWEHYLVTTAGVAADRIHDHAERLEHFTDPELRRRLSEETETPRFDPHGRPIPPEE